MSTVKIPKTAKLLNSLLESQKTDRARIQQLETRLTTANTRQAAAVTVAVREAAAAAEMQFKEAAAAAEMQFKIVSEALEASNWQIVELKQELAGVRQLLAAADASNEELRGIIETLANNLDKATQAAADQADERAEITRKREELTHILDTVRERMRKRERANENAILNRRAIASIAPGVNFK